jgi:hypothetical protein
MPSVTHQALVELFRARPALAPEVLAEPLAVPVPAHTRAVVTEPVLDQLVPAEFRADLVIELCDGEDVPVAAIVVEVQLADDADKPWTWPVYVAALRARLRRPVYLLVVAPDATVAAWAARPIELAPRTGTWQPLVLGPSALPPVDDPATARRHPELTLLTLVAHAKDPAAAALLAVVPEALGQLDAGLVVGYLAMILGALAPALRARLEALLMASTALAHVVLPPYLEKLREEGRTEGLSEGLTKGRTEGLTRGKAQAVLEILAARGLTVSDAVRAKVLACTDEPTLDRWIARAVVAPSAAAVVRVPRRSPRS